MKPTELTFGRTLIGMWICSKCNETFYPTYLRKIEITVDRRKVKCPECKIGNLTYDEDA